MEASKSDKQTGEKCISVWRAIYVYMGDLKCHPPDYACVCTKKQKLGFQKFMAQLYYTADKKKFKCMLPLCMGSTLLSPESET